MSVKKIFITGVGGYLGGSIAEVLKNKGYEITGLVRNKEFVQELEKLGISPVIGHIHDLKLLKNETAKADAVINTANADDVFAAVAFLEAMKGTGKTLINTSGTSLLAKRSLGKAEPYIYDESFPFKPDVERAERVLLNDYILRSAKSGIRTIVVVPPMVYGVGLGLKKQSAQIPALEKTSIAKGAGVYIEEGENIWSNVHIADLAELYALALELAPSGSIYYAENGEASLKDIALAISNKVGFKGKTLSIPIDEAIDIWGPEFAYYGLSSNSRVSALKAKQSLGWNPIFNSVTDSIEKDY